MKNLFIEGLELVVEEGRVSVSGIQKRFKIGFCKAVSLIEEYENKGI